jgi:hypothetical protein
MFECGIDRVYEERWRQAASPARGKRHASSAPRGPRATAVARFRMVGAGGLPCARQESRTQRQAGRSPPSNVALLPTSASFVQVRARWSDGAVSCYQVVLPAPGSMDIYIFCAWLEAEVKKQAGVDPFTQVRFTSDRDLLALACINAVEGGLIIHASVLAPGIDRLRGALQAGKKRFMWAAGISLVESALPCRSDPSIAAVRVDGCDHLAQLYVKAAPGKNSTTMLEECAWLALESHPNVLPVVVDIGPNLFVIARDSLASTNAATWLRHVSHDLKLPAACRRRLACAMMLQVAEAVEHIHSQGALHLDLKPDNVLVSIPDSVAPLHARVACQLCDWELVSRFEHAPAKSRHSHSDSHSHGGTPGFWSPEQVVPLPSCRSASLPAAHALECRAVEAYWRAVCIDPPPVPMVPRRVSASSDSWGLGTLLLALGLCLCASF